MSATNLTNKAGYQPALIRELIIRLPAALNASALNFGITISSCLLFTLATATASFKQSFAFH